MAVVKFLSGDVEYLHWSPTGLPDDATEAQVSVDQGVTWVPATIETGVISILAAHYDVTSPPVGSITIPVGYSEVWVKLADTPEVVVREAGLVYAE